MADTTRELTPHDDGAPAERARWGLVVAYHPDRDQVGTRMVVPADAPFRIGRARGLLDDPTLSRSHARVILGPAGPEIEDAGSRNGTFVNGEPVQRQPLRAQDLIAAGNLLFLVVPDVDPLGSPGAALAAEIARVARLATPVLFTGEVGAGKGWSARALHEASGRDPLVALSCGAAAADQVAAELFGLDAAAQPPGRPGLLERAHGGSLLLDDVDDAPRALQAALLAFLDDGAARRVGGAEARRLDVRVIATTRNPAALPAELSSRLRLVLGVPPLRERVEDLPGLIRVLLASLPGSRWARRALVQALLRHPYKHNVRELAALLERAAIDAGDEPMLGLSRGVAEALGLRDVGSPGALVVSVDGAWFRPPGASRVSLARRDNLAQLLRALVAAHREEPGRPLTTDALFAAGWPGDRIRGPAATGRVYVALTTLRNLGLREVLVRSDGGYALAPTARIEIAG